MTLGSDNAQSGTAPPPAPTGSETPPATLDAADPAPAASPAPAAAKTVRARLSRFREWFTRTQALRDARAAVGAPVVRGELLLGAFSAIELAERCLHGRAGRTADPAHACDAARRAVLLALSSLVPVEHAGTPPRSAAALLDSAPGDLLARAGPVEDLERVRADVEADFRTDAELPTDEQRATAERLILFARGLCTALEAPEHVADRFVRQRVLRLGTVAMLLLGSLLLLSSDVLITFRDLAAGKTWRASSTYGNGGCRSPAQTCPESPFFFFHTVDEDNPWVEIDLGRNMKVSELVVTNRSDCCGDRAVPLTVEVSTKRSRWKTVARIDGDFQEWRPSFKPVETRYVRLKAARKTMLHLHRVRVLP